MKLLTSALATGLRQFKGLNAQVRLTQPEQMLELYDMEGCPFCRPVREVLTTLDLDVLIYPCAKGAGKYREQLKSRGGKVQVPCLYDPNKELYIYESKDIISYLISNYSLHNQLSPKVNVSIYTSYLATAMRLGAGTKYKSKAKNDVSSTQQSLQPLELFSFEGSPFVRLVREKLCELGISYVVRNSGKQQLADQGMPWLRPKIGTYQPIAGTKRAELLQRTGKVQFPYLYDPNTQKELFESKAINKYLVKKYG